MNHRRLPLVLGLAALLGTLAGCADTPRAAVASPHALVDFAISRDTVTPRFAEMHMSRFEFVPRSESFQRRALLAAHGR
jgi:hypothetical protein